MIMSDLFSEVWSSDLSSPAISDYLHHRFGRILTGLSRQLRAPLEHDVQKGEYAIAIALCDERTRIALRSILAVIRPKSAGERRKPAFRDAGANPGHELLIEADIMLGHQHSTQYFPRFHQMMQRSEEHTSELQSLMRISYAVFCLKKKNKNTTHNHTYDNII